MLLNFSAKFGSFRAVTSFIAPFIDFSRDKSFTSSVALTSLSPEILVRYDYFSVLQFRLHKGSQTEMTQELTVAAGCYKP